MDNQRTYWQAQIRAATVVYGPCTSSFEQRHRGIAKAAYASLC